MLLRENTYLLHADPRSDWSEQDPDWSELSRALCGDDALWQQRPAKHARRPQVLWYASPMKQKPRSRRPRLNRRSKQCDYSADRVR
jgi:hypothetical protein